MAPSSRDASPVPVAFDEAEGHQNKKQQLSDSVVTNVLLLKVLLLKVLVLILVMMVPTGRSCQLKMKP